MRSNAQLPPGPGRQLKDNRGGRSSGANTTRRYEANTPNDPPDDHADNGWWAAVLDEVESGLLLDEVDR